MLYIAITGSGSTRTVSLRQINALTFEPENASYTLLIPNTSQDYSSEDKILAYYPNFYNYTAIVFVNLQAVIPCYSRYELTPSCLLFSFGDNDFPKGRPHYVQTTDTGSDLHVFSNGSNSETYGFGVSGCATFKSDCVSSAELSLICLLPANLCK